MFDQELAVIDSSVAIKWLFNEKGSEDATDLIDQYELFVVPDLFLLEVDAVISKNVRARQLALHNYVDVMQALNAIPIYKVVYEDIRTDALLISTKHMITTYDATFTVVALKFNLPFYTSDKRLYNTLTREFAEINVNLIQ